MGDISNMADTDRFLRSESGKQYLKEIVDMIRGRSIVDVTFGNDVHCVVTTLHLDSGDTFAVHRNGICRAPERMDFGYGRTVDIENVKQRFPAKTSAVSW